MKKILLNSIFALALLSLAGCYESASTATNGAKTSKSMKCGAGKCGAGMKKGAACASKAGKCGTGKCGDAKKAPAMKCGAGKCGSSK